MKRQGDKTSARRRVATIVCMLAMLPCTFPAVAGVRGQASAEVFGQALTAAERAAADLAAGVSPANASPEKPSLPEGALNPTPSPDSTMTAYTLAGNLFVQMPDGSIRALTEDGGGSILNGRASWVYFEEIFGRPSAYKAFWWSPDSRRIAFYRFDESRVPSFPIYSPWKGLTATAYPCAGEPNPEVHIGIADLSDGSVRWADFDPEEDQYFGTPFWSADGTGFYVQWMPRRQNRLRLYRLDARSLEKTCIYEESHPTWVEWIEGMLFGRKGLYMARSSGRNWEQIYYLSYDGKELRCLSSGPNWQIELLRVEEKKGDVYFTARRDSRIRPVLYRLDRRGRITALTDPRYWVSEVKFLPDGRRFSARCSNARTPWFSVEYPLSKGYKEASSAGKTGQTGSSALPEEHTMVTERGDTLYALMTLPAGFDPQRRYPVLMEVYGGPGTPYVRDRWREPSALSRWCSAKGIIRITVDPASSGACGRRGMDASFGCVSDREIEDYTAWVRWLQAQPFVQVDRIGVEGFSFGGTTTVMLLARRGELFRCGIAGGGVYDWTLYDSHYTERFMDTPQNNPDGYRKASVLTYVPQLKTDSGLYLTHGTGDDNVHFQSTLILVDSLQRAGKQFRLMIYPDGMHGYRGEQAAHDDAAMQAFLAEKLLN